MRSLVAELLRRSLGSLFRSRSRRHVSLFLLFATAAAVAVAASTGFAQSPATGFSAAPKPAITSLSSRCENCARPPRDLSWEYRLQGRPRIASDPRIYDTDYAETPRSLVTKIHRRGGYAVCYVNVGAWEDWRADRDLFPAELLGNQNGWPGERHLDIRRTDVLLPIMRDRFEICRSKGFDAVEPDNIEGYANNSGFPLDATDQLLFNRAIAQTAHDLGLSAALKNDLGQARLLAADFDFAVVEECVQYRECRATRPFTNRHKPVLVVEYEGTMRRLCAEARKYRFAGLMQTLALNRPGRRCGQKS